MLDKVVTIRMSDTDYNLLLKYAKSLYPTCSVSKAINILLKPYLIQLGGK